MNGASVSWPSTLRGYCPLEYFRFVKSLTMAKLKNGGVTFASAYNHAVAAIESLCALNSDPVFL
jgi:hypothetical protein